MREEDFLKLSPKKQEELLAFRESQERVNDSEARLENQKRWRIVFERAPKETIPFIIYCAEVASVSLIGLIVILGYEGFKLYAGIIIIFCALFFPMLVLPGKSWEDLWRWFKEDVLRRKNKT